MKGIFSGRQIKALQGKQITRSQTAANALRAITAKYGGVQDNAHYYHKGKGEWQKYSLENDKKRTGKLAASKSEWAERPHKSDWLGIDTKEGKKVIDKKPRFSVSQLKQGNPVIRKTKALPKVKVAPITKEIKSQISKKQVDRALAIDRWAKFDKAINKDHIGNEISLKYGTDYVKTILSRRIKNAKIEINGTDIKIYSTDPEQAFTAVLKAFEKDNNGKNKVPLRHIRNKIFFRGFTISIHEQKGTFQPFTGEYKGYKYKVSAKPGRIEYYLNGAHKTGMDETFNINTVSKKYVEGMARITINDRLNTKTGQDEIIRNTPKPSNPVGRQSKPTSKLAGKAVTKKIEKPKAKIDLKNMPAPKQQLKGRNVKNTPNTSHKPTFKVVIKPAPKIRIIQYYSKGKRAGTYAPTKIVSDPLQAFKVYYKAKDKYDTGLMFEAGPGSLTTANEITNAARVDTPSVLYNAIIKKLFLDEYYAYLKYHDNPLALKRAPIRTLPMRENWNQGAVL